MSDLSKRLAELRADVQPRWSDERSRRVERSLLRRRRRQKIARVAVAVTAIVALVFVGQAALRGRSGTTQIGNQTVAYRPPENPPAKSFAMQLRDGSIAQLIDPASRLVELPATSEGERQLTLLELVSGSARFEVVRMPSRVFRVRAGLVVTEVLGTVFSVERRAERTHVSVERGRVRVSWPHGHTELGPGQSGQFPPETPPDEARPPVSARNTPPLRDGIQAAEPRRAVVRAGSNRAMAERTSPARQPSRWAILAQEGNFDSAYEALRVVGMQSVRGPAELLLAADVARLSRHPAEAVAPLRQLLRDHFHDPRAPLAAFTLGRGLLDELGRPHEAAEAFRTAQELAPEGPLAADALAREVEAWSRAGEPNRARERALLYLKQYPDGDRRRSMQRYGGVE